MLALSRFQLSLAAAVFCMLCISHLWQASPVWGYQEAPAEAVAEAPGQPESVGSEEDPTLVARKSESFLWWMIRASGIFGFLIAMVSFVMVAMIVMLLLQLRRDNYLPAVFIEDFERLLNEGNYQGAYEAAKSNDSFIGKVLANGMARVPRSYEDALQGMQEAGEEETLAMEQSIGYLSLIGSIAPMLGLLGTVQGMVASFQVIATSVVAPKPYQLADGIATALFTTLEGLVVAIPAIVCYSVFKNRLARFVMEAGFVSEELMKRFQGGTHRLSSPSPGQGPRPLPSAAFSSRPHE